MKKRVGLLAVLSVAVFCFAAVSAWASSIELEKSSTLSEILERGELMVGMNPGYMPFNMMSKKGEIIGFDVDMAKEMAKGMGVKLNIISTPWDGIIPALTTKKFDIIISGMTVNQSRNLRINFAEPYIVIGQTILLRKGLEGEVKSYRDLNDPKYKTGSMLGTTGEQAAKRMIPKAQYFSYDTEHEGALELLNGKIDGFVYDHPFNAIFHAQKGQGKSVFLDEPFTYEPLGWGIRKGDPDFLNWLNNFLNQVKHDGRYDRIYRKWFESTSWLEDVQ